MTALDIKWDVDIEDAYEKLNHMNTKEASDILKISQKKYKKLTEDERYDLFLDQVHNNEIFLSEFMGLPYKVEIPDSVGTDTENISNWLSDTYGYCHEGFILNTDKRSTGTWDKD